jgi:spore coat protein CotH
MSWKYLALLALGFSAFAQDKPKPPTMEDFLDDNVLHEIRIDINPSDWKRLQDNFKDNTYYPANITWRGILVENVGIRSKGRTSRRADKPGLRVDINRYEDQNFLGQKSFLLDNNIQDFTMIKERLTMLLMRQMGLPAPRETHTTVYINDRYVGVYAITESTDKNFLKRWLDDNDGFLYEWEFLQDFRFQYLGDDTGSYSPTPFKPSTHETDPEPKPIEEMIRAINQSSDADFVRAVGEYLDIKKFLTLFATESYLAEFDGILSDQGINNLYFYRFTGKNLGMFIPKDKDNTFTSINYPMLKNADKNVLVRRCMANKDLKDFLFNEILRAASLAGGDGGWLDQEIVREYGQIKDAAYSDTLKECFDPPCTLEGSNSSFERNIAYLRQIARERQLVVLKELVGYGLVLPEGMTLPPEP